MPSGQLRKDLEWGRKCERNVPRNHNKSLGIEEIACKLTQEYRERAHASAFKAQGCRGGQEKVEETGDMGAEQNRKVWFPGSRSFKRVLRDIKKWNKMRIEKWIFLLPVRSY